MGRMPENNYSFTVQPQVRNSSCFRVVEHCIINTQQADGLLKPEKWLANPDLCLKRERQQKLLDITYRERGVLGS